MMTRGAIFGFRVNQDERRMIEALAARLQRTQSDAVRLIVREAAQELLCPSAIADDQREEGVANDRD